MFDFIRKHDWRLKTRRNGSITYVCRKCGKKLTTYYKSDLPKRGCKGAR